jgi:hypothetical protein
VRKIWEIREVRLTQPQIEIEFGRGDQQPSHKSTVTPFVAENVPDVFREKAETVLVLDSDAHFGNNLRFCVANHRPDPTKLKLRMARHRSDVAVMSTAERFADEKLSLDLLALVIRFKKIYFAANWAQYDTAAAWSCSRQFRAGSGGQALRRGTLCEEVHRARKNWQF